jgi:eukaryotic-like serine/threonine-protein kinase
MLADRLSSVSRYELLAKIASGGMATVYVGQIRSSAGFRRLVAIKRAHAHIVADAALRDTLVTEARVASMIHHPHVVAVQDVEYVDGELLLVMDYVEGASLFELLAAGARLPLSPRVAVRIALDACAGLHAAHELADIDGEPMGLIHRDISPQNVMVGVDGTARIVDFGIAKALQSSKHTQTGTLKGKTAYMAPEYLEGGGVSRATDVFALGVTTWEALTGERLFRGRNDLETMRKVTDPTPAPLLSAHVAGLGGLDEVVAKALAKDPRDRYSTALAFGDALDRAARALDLVASTTEIAVAVTSVVGVALSKRRALIRDAVNAEPRARDSAVPVSAPPDQDLGASQASIDAKPAPARPSTPRSESDWDTRPLQAAPPTRGGTLLLPTLRRVDVGAPDANASATMPLRGDATPMPSSAHQRWDGGHPGAMAAYQVPDAPVAGTGMEVGRSPLGATRIRARAGIGAVLLFGLAALAAGLGWRSLTRRGEHAELTRGAEPAEALQPAAPIPPTAPVPPPAASDPALAPAATSSVTQPPPQALQESSSPTATPAPARPSPGPSLAPEPRKAPVAPAAATTGRAGSTSRPPPAAATPTAPSIKPSPY